MTNASVFNVFSVAGPVLRVREARQQRVPGAPGRHCVLPDRELHHPRECQQWYATPNLVHALQLRGLLQQRVQTLVLVTITLHCRC